MYLAPGELHHISAGRSIRTQNRNSLFPDFLLFQLYISYQPVTQLLKHSVSASLLGAFEKNNSHIVWM